MFKLGQEVVISGKFVKAAVSPSEVQETIETIRKTGAVGFSYKYDVERFTEPKHGIVVGVRSIVRSRVHRMVNSAVGPYYNTETRRQPAYVVATNMRGLYYVPVDMIEDADVFELSDIDEFEFDDELEMML
ncbi:hypothetical protein K7T73_15945 [Bacillus badius]|uniref:hypothetical protein n=1 Tax=Bacillus badius TaxID=1455 RepID=UPI001CBEAC15|nr:hypothetical protein [Bacillus badius]UAT30030.1 hypothetical protein K7T73_15945 [Bacillus badius]